MTTKHASSIAEFSLSPMFRRQYPSTYEALEDCRPQRNQAMKLFISRIPSQKYLTLAIDHTPWPRPEAKTLKDRTYEHQGKTKQGIVIGQGYSTIAWLPDGEGSWALPLRHERITSWESPISKAVWQLKQVLKHCQQKVIVLLDREYGNAKWVLATAELKDVDLVTQYRLPWQSAKIDLSPGRVAQSIFTLLVEIGTPAIAPKLRGKSTGRAIGYKCTPRTRYPVAKKTYSQPKKSQQTA